MPTNKLVLNTLIPFDRKDSEELLATLLHTTIKQATPNERMVEHLRAASSLNASPTMVAELSSRRRRISSLMPAHSRAVTAKGIVIGKMVVLSFVTIPQSILSGINVCLVIATAPQPLAVYPAIISQHVSLSIVLRSPNPTLGKEVECT